MRALALVVGMAASSAGIAAAQTDEVRPFKLGTFERDGRALLGLVIDDRLIVDIAAANAALEAGDPSLATLAMPGHMRELIERYENGLRERLHALAAAVRKAMSRPAHVYEREALRVRPPVPDPEHILNAARNYAAHAEEMGRRAGAAPSSDDTPAPPGEPGLWQRPNGDTRLNPYMFTKLRSALIADGDVIRLPPGRAQIDYECELTAVVGRRSARVPVERAREHVFGYTLHNDVSDRQDRADGRYGSDWLVGKSHDTFAPTGPFIVPKEFVPDPQELGIRLRLSGAVMQDSNTELMLHTVDDLVSYASHILTLLPGDLISTGTPSGVGAGRTPPVFMKAGDVAECSIERVGTLTNSVVGP